MTRNFDLNDTRKEPGGGGRSGGKVPKAGGTANIIALRCDDRALRAADRLACSER